MDGRLSNGLTKAAARLFGRASLGSKFILAFVGIALVGFLGMLIALTATIIPSFELLESNEANRHIERTEATLDEFAKRVETAVRDYGAWDDSFTYLENPTRSFEQGTFSLLALTNLDVSGMAYVRFDGKVVFSRWYNLETQVEIQSQVRAYEAVLTSKTVIGKARAQESSRFYARIGDQIAAISVARVVRTDGSGKPIGYVAMARRLDTAQLKELLQLDANLSSLDTTQTVSSLDSDKFRHLSVPILGIDGAPVSHVHFSIPRSLSAMGARTLLIAFLSSVFVMCIALFGLGRLIKRLALTPLKAMESHMQSMSGNGDLDPMEFENREDEIGSLIRNFNQMLSQLKDLREQLEIQSFKLGRTESAVGLMHNVRNGLNPVSIILAQTESVAAPIPPAMLGRAVVELADTQTPAPRREKLAAFLEASHASLVSALEQTRTEIGSARSHLSRVVELIGEQQATAHEPVPASICDLRAIVEQNAALASYSATGKVRFAVSEGQLFAQGNRVLLSQVLGNLFGNAVESIQAAGRSLGVVEVSFTEETGQRGPEAVIIVRDNGEGFEGSRQKLMFEKGFSTREHKSGGLGLHWCSHALSMMGGTLTLESEGLGLGATAIVRLPAVPQRRATADTVEQAPANDTLPEVFHREIQSRR